MNCLTCGRQLSETAVACDICRTPVGEDGKGTLGNNTLRPGGKAHVSPEGIIYGTDGKYRWVYEVNLKKRPDILLGMLIRFAAIGAVAGVVPVLLQISGGVGQAVLNGLPLLLGLTAVGALLALAVFACLALGPGGVYCVVFALDETMICQQRVKDRVDQQKVAHIIAEWVGGQSQPFLRFRPVIGSELETVRSIRAKPEQDLLLIRDASGTNRIYLESQQFTPVMNYLMRHCPGAKIKM